MKRRGQAKVFVIIGVVLIIFLFIFLFAGISFPFAIIGQKIDFAGLEFEVSSFCGNFDVKKDGEFLVLTARDGEGYIEADVSDIDELLVIYDGYVEASCSGSSGGNANSGIYGYIVGSKSSISSGESVGTTKCINSIGETAEKYVEPGIWKFKNNFDGTWSVMKSIGVGDIFIVENTNEIVGEDGIAKLRLVVSGSSPPPCGDRSDTFSKETLKIYNIVRKEDAFAVCKADEFIQDINQDGKITPDECFDLETIVLNSEEAIKESFDEKLERIEQELLAKQASLEQENDELEEQLRQLQDLQASDNEINELLDRILSLEEELKQTNQRLEDVQAGDSNVIGVIEAQEQFEEPRFFKKIWNKIVAFFKNLF